MTFTASSGSAPAPRVLLSIDYEPWFALTRRFDSLADPRQRCALDGGYAARAIGPILQMLAAAKASFYLVGEIADWHPEVPQKIVAAGHELGFHCQVHRPLVDVAELAEDLRLSEAWRRQYNVHGYRAPMVGIREAAYPLLEQAGFRYSSSIYAPAGTLIRKGGLWELPVSTLQLGRTRAAAITGPRDFSTGLLLGGEVPYGSSFMIGLMSDTVLRILERELKAGLSPVLILHPYELVPPDGWPGRLARDLLAHPLLLPFTINKSNFLARLVQRFPVSPLLAYLDEALALRQDADE